MDEALLTKISSKMSPKAKAGFQAFMSRVEDEQSVVDDEDEYDITDVDGVAPMLASDVAQIQKQKILDLSEQMKSKNVFPANSDRPVIIINGVDINEIGEFGHTQLIRAVLDNDPVLVKELLNQGADKTIKDNSNQTAYDKAQRHGYYDCMALLDLSYIVPVEDGTD